MLSFLIELSSGFRTLDDEALSLPTRTQPLPKPPGRHDRTGRAGGARRTSGRAASAPIIDIAFEFAAGDGTSSVATA